MSYLVMDISKWQTVDDWSAVAGDVDGIIIRCGYRAYGDGNIYADTSFASHIAGAASVGIPLTVYFFSQAITTAEAEAEAEYAVNAVSGYTVSMPIFIDTEYSNTNHDGRADSLSKATRTAVINAFCARVVSLGYTAGIYASDSWYYYQLNQSDIPSSYARWVARYSDTSPQYVDDYIGWQYTSSGSVSGISTRVDLSHWYGEIGESSLPEKDSSKYYFDTYTGTSVSIITALSAVGCPVTSYSYRAVIAEANGITGYSGTSTQNTYMVTLIKAGLLIDPSGGDVTAPVLSIDSNICGTCVFTVTDDVYVASVSIDGESQTLADSYTVTGIGEVYNVVYSDVAGNTGSENITVADHYWVIQNVAASCESQGYTRTICAYCGIYTDSDFTEATGHDWYVADRVEPTCTTQGYNIYLCRNCGWTKLDDYEGPNGHNLSAAFTWSGYTTCYAAITCSEGDVSEAVTCTVTSVTNTAATCTTEGLRTYTAVATYDDEEFTDTKTEVLSATGHKYSSVITKPTCTEQGYTTYTCSVCGDTYIDNYTDALGHYWVTQVEDPTCTTGGYTRTICAYCGEYTDSDFTEATGHDWELRDSVAATCTTEGYGIYICNNCGNTNLDNYVDALGHDYETVTVDPTCTEDGYTTYTCTRCGDTYTDDYIPALGHNYETVVTEPTCEDRGYTTYTCTRCGDTYIDDYVDALGHDYSDEVTFTWSDDYSTCEASVYCNTCEQMIYHNCTVTNTSTESTCTEGGEIEYTASITLNGVVYTDTKEVTIAATGHNYAETVTAPTCTTQGYTTHTCIVCGDTYVDTYTDVIDHTYETKVTAPTCTEQGYTTYTCSVCGDTYIDDYTPANGHNYSEVVTDPTCTEQGYTTYTCEVCGNVYVGNYTDALGHDYEETVVEPTCTTEGYTRFFCSVCGDSYIDNYTPATGHNYVAIETTGNCLTGGYTTYVCSECGDSYISDYTEAVGHTYVAEVIAPTCDEGGYTIYTCSVCGDKYKSDYTDPTGHTFTSCTFDWNSSYSYCTATLVCEECGETVYSVCNITRESDANTCLEGGEVTYTATCDIDGFTDTNSVTVTVYATGHSYVGETIEATCTEDGYTLYTCEYCGDSYEGDTVKALGHDYVKTVVNPTCTSEGYTSYKCSRCGDSHTEDYTDIIDHNYVAVVTDPTCTTEGYTTWTCSMCGDSYTGRYTDIIEHNYTVSFVWSTDYTLCNAVFTCTDCGNSERVLCDVTVNSTDPTCTEDGITIYTATCTMYDETYTDAVTITAEALGHNYTMTVVEPTCTEEGYDWYYCAQCGDFYKENVVDALGHDWSFTRTVSPTCTVHGYDLYTCTRCKETKEENIVAATGHTYESVTIEPTCTDQGYTKYTCVVCNSSYNDNFIEALGHDYQITSYKNPTYDDTGYNTYTCSRCGDTYTETIAKLSYYEGLAVTIDQTDVYSLPNAREPECQRTGTYYIYSTIIENNRIMLTSDPDYVGYPQLVIGWVEVNDLDKTMTSESKTHYAQGDTVVCKQLSVYKTPSTNTTTARLNGTYYVSLPYMINDKIALCKTEDVVGNEDYIVGWAKSSDF